MSALSGYRPSERDVRESKEMFFEVASTPDKPGAGVSDKIKNWPCAYKELGRAAPTVRAQYIQWVRRNAEIELSKFQDWRAEGETDEMKDLCAAVLTPRWDSTPIEEKAKWRKWYTAKEKYTTIERTTKTDEDFSPERVVAETENRLDRIFAAANPRVVLLIHMFHHIFPDVWLYEGYEEMIAKTNSIDTMWTLQSRTGSAIMMRDCSIDAEKQDWFIQTIAINLIGIVQITIGKIVDASRRA
jgi:hypothetical protein